MIRTRPRRGSILKDGHPILFLPPPPVGLHGHVLLHEPVAGALSTLHFRGGQAIPCSRALLVHALAGLSGKRFVVVGVNRRAGFRSCPDTLLCFVDRRCQLILPVGLIIPVVVVSVCVVRWLLHARSGREGQRKRD